MGETEYVIVDLVSDVKWIRVDGVFYVSSNHIEEFKIKYEIYKKQGC
jgi:hypothetical protein